jgi:phosphoglycerate dehydrogenase-like enzyme
MQRPKLVTAHMAGIELFSPAELQHFDEVGQLLRPEPVSSWTDPGVADLLAQVEVIVGHWGCPLLDEAMLAATPGLGLYAHAAGTVKATVTDGIWERGVVVTSGANANAEPVAEFTLAAILFANKDIFWSRDVHRQPDLASSRPKADMAIGNWDKTVGIVGASLIGRRLIQLLKPFPALRVAVYDPYLGTDEARALGVEKMELDELCAASDVLSVHAPALPSTLGLIGRSQLAALRTGATLINTARGPLVDHDALIDELDAGRLYAVLDVTDPEPLPADSALRTLPNVFLTPHQAGSQGTELRRMAETAAEEVRRYAAGAPQLNQITRDRLDVVA